MVGRSCQEKDGVIALPQPFNDGCERGYRPAFLCPSATRVDGDAAVVGNGCSAFMRVAPPPRPWDAINLVPTPIHHMYAFALGWDVINWVHITAFHSYGFCQIIHHVCTFAFWWAPWSNDDLFDTCQTQVVFYYAMAVT